MSRWRWRAQGVEEGEGDQIAGYGIAPQMRRRVDQPRPDLLERGVDDAVPDAIGGDG